MKNYINISTPEGNMEFTPVPRKNGIHFIPSYESLDIQCTKEQMALWIEVIFTSRSYSIFKVCSR